MPKLTSKTLYLRLLGYVKPYRRLFALSIFFTVLLALTEPMLPALLKPLLDGSFVEKDPQTIRLMPFALVGVFLLRALTSYASTMTINAVSTRVVMDLRNQIFDKLLCLPNRFYDDNPTGTVLSKVTFNVEQVAAASTEVLIVLVRDSVAVLGLVGYMLWLNWRLTLVVFLLAPIIVLIVRLISKRLRRLSHSIQSSMGEMTHVLEEAIQGNQVIKLFGGQAYESGRFREISNWVRRYHMKRVAAASISSPAGQMVMVLGLAGMLYFASIQSLNDQLSVGSFVSFIAAIVMLLSPLKKLIRINEQLQQGLAAAESVFDLVDEPSEADQGQRPIERLSGQIHFERIHFSYQGASEPALRDIDLKIATGETVALVGPSGSGKSTLASLLPRFYELNQGRILLDGIDCR
ncbi:ABC transporter transmembrane domain-containing protein, partial [endosymbiont of Ridgeia piscesae]